MLTGVRDEADRVMGLELGADDYLTKPFSPRELLARIRTVLRRTKSSALTHAREHEIRAYRFADFELNLRTRRLKRREGPNIELTNREFNLLAALLAAPERILTRDQLLEASRVYDNEVYDRAIDVQVLSCAVRSSPIPPNPGSSSPSVGSVTFQVSGRGSVLRRAHCANPTGASGFDTASMNSCFGCNPASQG